MKRVLLAGVVGSLVLLALWWRPDPPRPAWAQGVGIFQRVDCTTITSAVAGQTWCFNQTARQLQVYTGSGWATVSVNNASPNTLVIGSQNELVNDYIRYTSTGTLQQLGLFLDMVGSNTESSSGQFRIPLAVRAQTGGGTNADGLDALNIVIQQNAADDVAYLNGIELSFNNNKRNDPLNPIDRNHFGMTIDAYGGFSTGPAALAIRTGAASSTWQRGLYIPVNTITLAGNALDYEGDGAGRVFRVDSTASVTIGNILTFPTGANGNASSGPAIFNNGGVAFTFLGGTSDTRWQSQNGGSELMRLANAGGLVVGSSGTTFGAGTVNIASASLMNGLASQVASGSGVNLTNIRGLSASSSKSNNLGGTCTFAGAATCQVAFTNNEPDANYFVMVGGVVDVSNKTRAGFLMTATGTRSNSVDWLVVR